MWLSRTFHRYFVALEETKVHLQCLGVPSERVTVSGIPIDPQFQPPADRRATRLERGLDPDLPTFLVSAGALGVSPAEGVVEAMQRLNRPVQLIVVCGKNEAMQTNIAALGAKSQVVKTHVLGYTTEMHLWMAAADVFIGKPGGLTTSEALAIGLPMVVVSPIPGQEERNSDHLLELGIAIRCNEFTTMPYKIGLLLDDPERLDHMRAQARKYGHPEAAATIVKTLLHDEYVDRDAVEIPPEPEVVAPKSRARMAMESFTNKFKAGFSAAKNSTVGDVP
jgi:processive 1,2-diacylglycerol beta-glucosyltransferase